MTPSEIQAVFEAWKADHKRNAWRPLVGDSGITSLSYFGGEPTASDGAIWPSCAQCSKPMKFFFQLDLSALPTIFDTPVREGVLQLFYCSSDDGMCETWEAFSGTHDLRIVPVSDRCQTNPDNQASFPKRVINEWQCIADFPSPAEHDSLEIAYDYNFQDKLVSVVAKKYGIDLPKLDLDLDVAELISEAQSGDKLGGWPAWVQGVEYPCCQICNSPMQLLFQLDSNDNLDYMFGDVGCGHVTQCNDHPEILAFAWAL